MTMANHMVLLLVLSNIILSYAISFYDIFYSMLYHHIGGGMVSVVSPHAVNRTSDRRSGQAKICKIAIVYNSLLGNINKSMARLVQRPHSVFK